MAVLTRLEKLLEDQRVPYEVHVHPAAYTATGIAHADHVPETEMAKVVILLSRGELLMVTLPASQAIDLPRMAQLLDDPDVRLAREEEFAERFGDCELGAMPPFGKLFGMPQWAEDTLGREAETAFSAGTHHETIHMAFRDFARLSGAQFGSFGKRPAH